MESVKERAQTHLRKVYSGYDYVLKALFAEAYEEGAHDVEKLIKRALDAIVFLSEDTDFICEQIHRNGGCDWCEKNCGDKCCPDATCVKAWIENYYDDELMKKLLEED